MNALYPSRVLPAAATCLGLLFLVVSVCVAVSHFALDNPVFHRRTDQPVSSGAILMVVLLFGAAGTLLTCAGIAALRAASRRRGDDPPQG